VSGSSQPFGEITVDSDRSTTALAAIAFIVLGLLLANDIRQVLWGTPNQIAIAGTLNRLCAAFTVFYGIFLAFTWPSRLVKVGCGLLTAELGVRFAFTYLRISPIARHPLVIARSEALQLSLLIFLVAIAQWFRTVVRWAPPSREEREGR
jgi:hypothetical protein